MSFTQPSSIPPTNPDLNSSTHNTQIECLWLEVGQCFARGWWAFFTRLGHLCCLKKENSHHLWLLHYLFLPDIKHDCTKFQKDWNCHPISGKGENLSPIVCSQMMAPGHTYLLILLIQQDLRLLGQVKHGVYDDTTGGSVDPSSLLGPCSGKSSYTSNPMESHLARTIADAQKRQIHHEAAEIGDS